MKCPICGNEMTLDSHRKIPLNMCYECGYIEGRNIIGQAPAHGETNISRMKKMNLNELVAFASKGLGIDPKKLADWLNDVGE